MKYKIVQKRKRLPGLAGMLSELIYKAHFQADDPRVIQGNLWKRWLGERRQSIHFQTFDEPAGLFPHPGTNYDPANFDGLATEYWDYASVDSSRPFQFANGLPKRSLGERLLFKHDPLTPKQQEHFLQAAQITEFDADRDPTTYLGTFGLSSADVQQLENALGGEIRAVRPAPCSKFPCFYAEIDELYTFLKIHHGREAYVEHRANELLSKELHFIPGTPLSSPVKVTPGYCTAQTTHYSRNGLHTPGTDGNFSTDYILSVLAQFHTNARKLLSAGNLHLPLAHEPTLQEQLDAYDSAAFHHEFQFGTREHEYCEIAREVVQNATTQEVIHGDMIGSNVVGKFVVDLGNLSLGPPSKDLAPYLIKNGLQPLGWNNQLHKYILLREHPGSNGSQNPEYSDFLPELEMETERVIFYAGYLAATRAWHGSAKRKPWAVGERRAYAEYIQELPNYFK